MMSRKTIFIHVAMIVLLTAVSYSTSLTNGFIWDDDDYVTNNFFLRSPEGLQDIWFSSKTPQYYPVIFTSFWIEYHLWGLNPVGYHAINLIFHIFNALLIYLILFKLKKNLALPVALLFALHPVNVETVAWVTERKNIYGTFFYLCAVLFYLRFSDAHRKRDYAFSLLSFVTALLSKSITVTFVAVPLLIQWWRKRLCKTDVFRMIPFFAIGLAAGLNTVILELFRVGAKGNNWSLPLLEHILLPGRIILFYIYKLIFPLRLIFIYPRWQLNAADPVQWLPLATVIIGLFLAYRYRESIGRGAFAALACFVLSLFPALGIFNVFPMIYSYVADHFQYTASIGMIIFLCAAVRFLFEEAAPVQRILGPGIRKAAPRVILAMVVLAFGARILSYTPAYENRKTLFADVIAKNPGTWMAYNNLGNESLKEGDIGTASHYFHKAMSLNPNDCVAYINLGNLLMINNQLDQARQSFETCLRSNPSFAAAYNNLGLIEVRLGHMEAAAADFEKAARLNPLANNAHLNLARVFFQQHDDQKAIEQCRKAIEIYPFYGEAYLQLGMIYARTNDLNAALNAFRKAARLVPGNITAQYNTGMLCKQMGNLKEARTYFRAALRLDPDSIEARYQLAEVLLSLGNKEEARQQFDILARAGVNLPNTHQKGSP
jgi:protein O-mannosyl-transferase